MSFAMSIFVKSLIQSPSRNRKTHLLGEKKEGYAVKNGERGEKGIGRSLWRSKAEPSISRSVHRGTQTKIREGMEKECGNEG